MPENDSTCWIRLLPCKKKKLFLSLAAILAILCKGIRSQAGQGYTITTSTSVSVQRGFFVYIPCQFTYNQGDLSRNEKVMAYWIKYSSQHYSCSPSLHQNCLPVATNDQNQIVERSAKDRFYLFGDPWKGDCSLFIRDARIKDEGQYYLRIEGKSNLRFSFLQRTGYISPYVHVIEPPQKVNITVEIRDLRKFGLSEKKKEINRITVKEGNIVNLICTADGRPSPSLSWMKENQKVGEPTGYLQLRQIGPEDAGKYQCLANNQHGSLKMMVEVIVQYHPKMPVFNISQIHRRDSILTQGCSKELASDSQLTAQEGDSLEVFCKADSNPPAATSWVKELSPLQKPLDNQLRLTNLTVADEGAYVCNATNMFGSIQGTFQLSVTYAPKLSRSPQKNTTCSYHDNGFLCVCTLHAKPPPQIEWEVDGERITEERRRRDNLTVQALVQKNEVTSTLKWMGSLDRAHNIICTGSNSYGIQSISFLLDARQHPTSESSTERSLFIAGICGILLGAGILMLCLFLIRVFKKKKALLEASHVEGTPSRREPQEESKNSSHIYGNIFPMSPRLSWVNKSKPAQERKPKVPQGSSVPAPRRSEPPELPYAAIDFKPKSKGVPALSNDDVEYSSIQRK